MSACLFSVVIPGYNRVEPLKYTLRSAAEAAARLAPGTVEIILVDDGSVPPLTEQLAGFDPGHPVVHVRQANQGSIIARLTGLSAAQGKRILFLDSDDLIAPEKLFRHHEAESRGHADIIYDDMAEAKLGAGYSTTFNAGQILARTQSAVELLLRIQPLPNVPSFDRDYLLQNLATPLVMPERRMDPSGDVWLYYNLAPFPASVTKVDAPLSAVGPHDELRYSHHWEKLGVASLLIAESFQRNCPETSSTHDARIAVGEAAFASWRGLPFDYPAAYRRRLVALWRRAPAGSFDAAGGPQFRFMSRLLGPLNAGWLYRRIFGRRYAASRTLNSQDFARLLGDHGFRLNSTRSMIRHFRPGRIVYQLWHRPVAALRRCHAEGGPLEQWRSALGRSAMRAAARNLTPPNGPGPALELHLLTGARFWEQTAFCLWSFARQSGRSLAPVIYDDGTLGSDESDLLRRLFPATRFVTRPEAAANLERHLPAAAYPFLHDRWLNYPNIRKLIDPHVGSSVWKLVIDSDLLFFHPPAFLVNWLDAPDRPLHAVDNETSYGYDRGLMDRLAGARVADLVNVGLTGLRGDEINWDRVESLCRELITTGGTHYYLEQALVAMLVAGRSCAVAPAGDYVTCPQPPESDKCDAVMHHYVADSKPWYFRHNWRRVLS